MQEVDKSLKVGYAVLLVDVDGDGKKDIVVVDSERVIWFENRLDLGRAGARARCRERRGDRALARMESIGRVGRPLDRSAAAAVP